MFFEHGHLVVEGSRTAVLFHIGPLAIRWYALAYITGLLSGWRLMIAMLKRGTPPISELQLGDLVVWVTAGVIFGGRIGYIFAYNLDAYLANPISLFEIWKGGMSYHGGAIGTVLAIVLFARRNNLSWLRILDYAACVQPIGQFLGRIANFLNGELWGMPTTEPWGVIFRGTDPYDIPRHPSQLYEALLEGVVLFAIMNLLFWKTSAYKKPGYLTGAYMVGFAIARFLLEFVREPDAQLIGATGPLHMGQWLSLPMIPIGLYLMYRARAVEDHVTSSSMP